MLNYASSFSSFLYLINFHINISKSFFSDYYTALFMSANEGGVHPPSIIIYTYYFLLALSAVLLGPHFHYFHMYLLARSLFSFFCIHFIHMFCCVLLGNKLRGTIALCGFMKRTYSPMEAIW